MDSMILYEKNILDLMSASLLRTNWTKIISQTIHTKGIE